MVVVINIILKTILFGGLSGKKGQFRNLAKLKTKPVAGHILPFVATQILTFIKKYGFMLNWSIRK